jgi:hypothetical protein
MIVTSPKRVILAATSGGKRVLRCMGKPIHQSAWRNCPKSPGRAHGVALLTAKEGLLAPFWPPYASQIHGRNTAHAPFRTVSEGEFSEVRGPCPPQRRAIVCGSQAGGSVDWCGLYRDIRFLKASVSLRRGNGSSLGGQ